MSPFGGRRVFRGRSAGGATASSAGFSTGIYVTPELALIDYETGSKVDKKRRDEIGWIYFRSKREAKMWIVLRQKENAGLIRNLRRQVKWELHCPAHKADGDLFEKPPVKVTSYTADYVFEEPSGAEWFEVVADAKGFPTELFVLKRKWLAFQYGITIREM